MPALRRAVMRAAVARGDHTVLAQGLAAGDPNAHEAGPKAKRDALEALLS
jgi:ribulose 1,5-bisphosphate carboxylase large subunit-like protein